VTHQISAVSMGNPHAVLLVPDVDETPVQHLGPLIENHPRFPNRVNAGFLQILDSGHIRLRVYERGTGETLACGTGACAAVVAGRLLGRLDPQVAVRLPGGELVVEWQSEGQPVLMRGTAETVFEGTIEL
jgi:diaminopimelate epimerase